MKISVKENFSIIVSDINSNEGKIKITAIELKGEMIDRYDIREFIGKKINDRFMNEYNNFIDREKYNYTFYSEFVYPSFYVIPYLPKYIKDFGYSYDINYRNILNGSLYLESSYDDKGIYYDLVEDRFNKSILDKVCGRYKYHFLALEQYKDNNAPKEFTELLKVLTFFKGKKTINVVTAQEIKKVSDLNIHIFSRYKSKILGFKYHNQFLKINHDLIKDVLNYQV